MSHLSSLILTKQSITHFSESIKFCFNQLTIIVLIVSQVSYRYIRGLFLSYICCKCKRVLSKLQPSTWWYFVFNYSCSHVMALRFTHGRHAWFASEKKKHEKKLLTRLSSKVLCKVQAIYEAWGSVFHYQMKHWENCDFYLRGVSLGDETLCRMLHIMSHNILLHETWLA